MAIKKNKNTVKARFEDYSVLIMGAPKSGKTTLFFETMLAKYGNTDAGAILPFERGYSHLSDVTTITCTNDETDEPKAIIEDWSEFVEIVDELVENRNTDWKEVKVILIDTVERMYMLAEKYTLQQSKKKTGKASSSINDAFGGLII